jgi:hypothetical protein
VPDEEGGGERRAERVVKGVGGGSLVGDLKLVTLSIWERILGI